MDYTVHGIFQARILEWVACLLSRDLPNPGIEPRSPTLQVDSLLADPQGKPIYIEYIHIYIEREKTKRKFTKTYLETIFLARYSGIPGDTYFLYFSVFSECFIL